MQKYLRTLLFLLIIVFPFEVYANSISWKKPGKFVTATLVCSLDKIEKLIDSENFGFQNVFVFELTSLKENDESQKRSRDVFYGSQYYLAEYRKTNLLRVVPGYLYFFRNTDTINAYGTFGMLTLDGIVSFLSFNRETLKAEYTSITSLKYECIIYEKNDRLSGLKMLQSYKDSWEIHLKKKNKI